MSQVARQLQLCPGSPRRIRVQNRRLCLCGPGGGGPTCGLCAERALTGDPCDQCGGLLAPLVKIGSRFRVERALLMGGVRQENLVTIGITNAWNANAVYADSMVIAARDDVPGYGGVCQWTLEEWAGGGSMHVDYHYTGPGGPLNSEANWNGLMWEWQGLTGPPTMPGPQLLYNDINRLAYPNANLLEGLKLRAEVSFLTRIDPNLLFTTSINVTRVPLPLIPGDPWPAEATFCGFPCAGSEQRTAAGVVWTESWTNVQEARFGQVDFTDREQRNDAQMVSDHIVQWRYSTRVTTLDPCPGDAPDRNAAAIAGFMAQGERAGCCG